MEVDRSPIFVHIPRTGGTSIRHALRLGTQELHTPAPVLRRRVGPAAWGRRVTFTVIRNPWTRALSLYRHLARGADGVHDFRRWVRHGCPAPERDGICVSAPMTEIIGGVTLYIARFEKLEEGWAVVRKELQCRGWPYLPRGLPHVNRTPGDPGIGLSGWYDRATVERVSHLYGEDVEIFGYAPPPSCRPLDG